MRAFREANTNTGVDILLQSEYDALMEKDPKVMYITYALAADLDTTACTLVIANVYVGTQEHDVLVNNSNIIVWMREAPIDYIMDNYHTIYHEEEVVVPYTGNLNYSIPARSTDTDTSPLTGVLPYSGNEDYTCMINVPINSFYNIPIPLHQLV